MADISEKSNDIKPWCMLPIGQFDAAIFAPDAIGTKDTNSVTGNGRQGMIRGKFDQKYPYQYS